MSEVLATATGEIIVEGKDRADSIAKLMELNREVLVKSLPKHLTPDRLIRVAVTCIRKVKRLGECTIPSLAGAIMESAQLGLELGHGLGHAWMVPYKNNRINAYEAQFQIGYRGMVDLAYRSNKVDYCEAVCVHKDDTFSYQRGTEPKITHIPSENDDRAIPPEQSVAIKTIKKIYAVAHLSNGRVAFEVMTVPEIEKVRARSRAGNDGPWITDWPEMGKKTVFRRLFKWLPVSVEMQRAVSLDEQLDAGMEQAFDSPLDLKDIDVKVTDAKKPEPEKKKSPPKTKKKPAPKPKPEPEEEVQETQGEEPPREEQGTLADASEDDWAEFLGD